MYDVLDINTGEVVMTCNDFEHRWYDEGKRRVKKELKAMGYRFVKVEYSSRWPMVVYVEQEACEVQ